MEWLRRIFLLTAFLTAIIAAFFADLSPVILIRPINFFEQQRKEGSYMGVRIPTERAESLIRMPQQVYINEVTKGRLFDIEGQAWKAIVDNAIIADKGKSLSKEWRQRLPSDKYPMGVLFFRIGEFPVNQFAYLFRKSNDKIFLRFKAGEKSIYLKVEFRVYSNNDFHLGSGFSNYPTPPTDFLYPARKWSPWILLAGLAFYTFLPWPKHPRGALAYRRWRVIMSDIPAIITILFFALPIFIVGGFLQTFTEGWPLLFFFWPIFFIGLIFVWLAVSFSAFALLPMEDRFRIWSPKGQRDFLYSDMEFFQPIVFKPPKWLITLSWIAVLAGKGNARLGATGRAMLISSAECGSIAIHLKGGKDLFIGITDQMGTDMINGQHIINTLKKSGIKEIEEIREIRSLGLEIVRLPKETG
jgi:hypothetical protein